MTSELAGRSNVHLLEGDVTNYDSLKVYSFRKDPSPYADFLKSAAAESSKITGGSLDYLIANAGYVSFFDPFDGIGTLYAFPPLSIA